MNRFYCIALIGLAFCSPPKPAGKRVSLSKGNISFILPDSSLIYSKPILWPADYQLGSYGEDGAFYHNRDSSIVTSIYVQVYPNPEQRQLKWQMLTDENRRRGDLLVKNRTLAVIERFKTDSIARTIIIDYHIPKRPKKGTQSQASYGRDFTFYGPQRTIHFCFFGPDNLVYRKAVAAACASVRIKPIYLQASVKPYPAREYQD